MHEGHIKLFRKLRRSAFYLDSQYVHIWIHLLMSVNWAAKRLKLKNSDKFVDLKPGQVLTSRDTLAKETGINSSKVHRILTALESEQQIEQQTFTKYRIISILNWTQYQCTEQQIEQQMNNKRTTDEHKEEGKEGKEKKPYPRKKPSGDHAVFIDWWCYAYSVAMEKPYLFQGGKDGKAVTTLLQKYKLKELIATACHFLTMKDDFLGDRRDLTMLLANINRLPSCQNMQLAPCREIGILPPDGVMFEDWNYQEATA